MKQRPRATKLKTNSKTKIYTKKVGAEVIENSPPPPPKKKKKVSKLFLIVFFMTGYQNKIQHLYFNPSAEPFFKSEAFLQLVSVRLSVRQFKFLLSDS